MRHRGVGAAEGLRFGSLFTCHKPVRELTIAQRSNRNKERVKNVHVSYTSLIKVCRLMNSKPLQTCFFVELVFDVWDIVR